MCPFVFRVFAFHRGKFQKKIGIFIFIHLWQNETNSQIWKFALRKVKKKPSSSMCLFIDSQSLYPCKCEWPKFVTNTVEYVIFWPYPHSYIGRAIFLSHIISLCSVSVSLLFFKVSLCERASGSSSCEAPLFSLHVFNSIPYDHIQSDLFMTLWMNNLSSKVLLTGIFWWSSWERLDLFRISLGYRPFLVQSSLGWGRYSQERYPRQIIPLAHQLPFDEWPGNLFPSSRTNSSLDFRGDLLLIESDSLFPKNSILLSYQKNTIQTSK